jgi:acyl carrier protein
MDTSKSPVSGAATSPRVTAAEIEAWLTTYLANLLNLPETRIEKTIPFEQFGLDSAAAVAMTGDLARWLGAELDPNVTFEDRTIQALAARIAG